MTLRLGVLNEFILLTKVCRELGTGGILQREVAVLLLISHLVCSTEVYICRLSDRTDWTGLQ